MEHLRAELEIRGLKKCAEELPEVSEKCYKRIKEVVEACSKGDCFVEPEKVIEEAEGVRVRRSNRALYALLALASLEAVLIIVLTLKLTALEQRVNAMENQLASLTVFATRKFNLMENMLTDLQKKVKELAVMKDTLEALKYAVYLLGK